MRIEHYRVGVPDADLADLRRRIAATRWPEPAPATGWAQGFPADRLRELCDFWAGGYDWRATEARLNAVPQFRTVLDGVEIHFLHVRSPHPGALPLILTHGWPGSVLEYLDLVGPLTDPVAHGGSAVDAFDVVLPSLPGYGFSGKPTEPGWGVERIAAAWADLMRGLGYQRFGAAGSDWGTSVSSALGALYPDRLAGIHLVPPLAGPDPADTPTDAERTALADLDRRASTGSAYSEVHRTTPQTVGYALVDSPVGLCAWMGEKLWNWTDNRHGDPALTREQILDQVTLYWLTGSAASSARLYAESIGVVSDRINGAVVDRVRVPTGASIFPAEVPRPSRRWAERRYPDLRYWAEHDRGGHFPALEVPDLLVDDLRAFFAAVR
jgi:pimeloyl-ACP methyl ester carboxylesterase